MVIRFCTQFEFDFHPINSALGAKTNIHIN